MVKNGKKVRNNLKEASNIENLSVEDWHSIFREKETIYEERRKRIQAYCKTQPSDFSKDYENIFWYPESGISMCLINKIGSSTYFEHFARLAKVNESRKKIKQRFLPPKSKHKCLIK